MKRCRFSSPGILIDADLDLSGRYFTTWRPHVSQHFRDSKALLRWMAWPPKTPTGDALRQWLEEVRAADAARREPVSAAGDANVAGSFDPLAHEAPAHEALDASDANHATRTII
jgi:hypothetical protein